MIREESILSAKVESLQNENDIAVEQLAAMKGKSNNTCTGSYAECEKRRIKQTRGKNSNTDRETFTHVEVSFFQFWYWT